MHAKSSFEPERVVKAIKWLLLEQNSDGSWGRNLTDKVRWTANAVYSFHLLGLNTDFKPINKAIDWLKKVPETHGEWYLRIPPLCAFGLNNWLENRGDFNRITQLFATDSIGPLAIKVAISLDLIEEGIPIPKIDLTEIAILSTLRDEANGLCSFAGSTNDTSLYCDFLNTLFKNKHNEIVEKCLRWIFVRRIEKKDQDAICWEESYGKTAYVTLNLLKFIEQKPEIELLLPQIFEYYKPTLSGAIPPDNLPAHESKSSIYTTILFIRLFAKISEYNKENYKHISVFLLQSLFQKPLLSIKRRYQITFFLFSIFCFTATGYLAKFILGKEFLISIVASTIGGIFPSCLILVYRAYSKLLRNISSA